ncbi:UNVERIFIED_CONTAM: hypothetical protein Slati_0492000 [Sesamum latifolium]|uniref:Uncharacterized protein n=1 Tax=Sesamum latifolium TaxID=2727402 RepID=A0AAW2XYJ3_9LAMI
MPVWKTGFFMRGLRRMPPSWNIYKKTHGQGLFVKGACLGQGLFLNDACLGAGLAFCEGCPLEEVFEEVLWRGGSVSGSAGLGGPRTTVPLAGSRDVPGTTCRA